MAELIGEGQDASTIRVSVDTTGEDYNPLDTSLNQSIITTKKNIMSSPELLN